MAAGIVLYFQPATEPRLLPVALLATGSFLGALLARHPVPRAALLCAALSATGFASAGIATWRAPPWATLPRTATIVTGTVAALETLPEGRRVSLAAPSLDGAAPLARALRIRLRDTDTQTLAAGDRLQVRALIQPPPPPAYPGGWNMQRDAFFAGIAGYGFAIGPATRLHHAAPGRLQAWREAIAARIMEGLPGENGAIAATLLTGLGAAIPPDDRRAFQDSGLAHLLAVAGLHMGIVMGMFFLLTRKALAATEYSALYWPTRSIAALVALAAGAAYLALTGAHVPTLRSFAMASLITLATLTGRRALSLRALALAAVALMLIAPHVVMGVSFQMSFAAVLALIAGFEALRPFRATRRYVLSLVLTSLLAGTATLPFAAYHFGTLTPYYVPANLLAVPLTAFWVLPLCLASLALMPFGWERAALVPAGWGIHATLGIARAVAAWPDAVITVRQMPGAALALMALGLVWLCLWRSRLRLAGLAPLAAGLLAALAAPVPDLLVSPDIVAARVDGQVFAEAGKRAGPFALQAPARVWGQPGAPFPSRLCDDAACRFDIGGQHILLVRGKADCGGAAIVLTTARLGAGCTAPVMIDAGVTRLQGAIALYVAPCCVRRVTDRESRPWVYVARRLLPPARRE